MFSLGSLSSYLYGGQSSGANGTSGGYSPPVVATASDAAIDCTTSSEASKRLAEIFGSSSHNE